MGHKETEVKVTMKKQAYTVKEIKTVLQLDRTTVYRLLRSGEIAAARCGRQWRVAPEVLRDFLRGGGGGAKQKKAA